MADAAGYGEVPFLTNGQGERCKRFSHATAAKKYGR
jgi:hypothetical protein